MAQTKQEIRNAWNKEHYKSYQVNLRYDQNADLIEKVEKRKAQGQKVKDIFIEALEKLEG